MSSPISRHFPIFYSPTSQILRLSLVFLLLLSLSVDSFSRGAPESACEEDMRPRHGFATQGGRPPAEIVVDQSEVRQDHYLRVTLRSTKPFKGFLLRAEDAQEKRNVATTCRPGGPCEDPGHSCGGLPHLLDRHPCPRRHRGRQAGGPCPTDPVCEQ